MRIRFSVMALHNNELCDASPSFFLLKKEREV